MVYTAPEIEIIKFVTDDVMDNSISPSSDAETPYQEDPND